jgi:uncharacterized protein (TIRG00374 family)
MSPTSAVRLGHDDDVTRPAGSTRGRIVWTLVRLGIGAALIAWLVHTGALDWAAMGTLVDDWPVTAGASLLLIVAFIATAARLVVLCGPTALRVTLAAATQLTLVGAFFNLVMPGAAGGDVVRIWYATHGHEGRRAEVVAIFLLDRIIGMFTLVATPLLVLPFFPSIRSVPTVQALAGAATAVAIGMLVGLVVLLSERLRRSRLSEWLFARGSLGAVLRQMVDALRIYRHAPGALLAATGVSLVAQGLSFGATLLLARVILGPAFTWDVLVLIPLGFLANTVPATPGGLGVGETAFDRLFHLAGLANGGAVLFGWRLLMLLPAAVGLAVYLGGRRRFVSSTSGEPRV